MTGILFDNRKGMSVVVAARMALKEFRHAEHTQGLEPAEIRFHPRQKPADETMLGLKVKADKDVPLHYIRILAAPSAVEREFTEAKAEFESLVAV